MQVGDLIIEKTNMDRKPEMGIVLRIDGAQHENGIIHPYQVYFFDGETCWMREDFLKVVSAG